jgi:hypothetical protein
MGTWFFEGAAWPGLQPSGAQRQAAQQRLGAADCGEYRQAPRAIAKTLILLK